MTAGLVRRTAALPACVCMALGLVACSQETNNAAIETRGADVEVVWAMPDQPGLGGYPSSFTPDGRTLLITKGLGDSGNDVFALELETGAPPRPLFPNRASGTSRIWPRLSPSGTLLAYTSLETGRFEVYLHRYPGLSEKTAISVGGGCRPTWAPDGRALYYQWGTSIFAVDVESAEPPRVSRPRTVLARAPDLRFDVGQDGAGLVRGVSVPADGELSAAAVTQEPAGGSQQPTSPILLVGSLPKS